MPARILDLQLRSSADHDRHSLRSRANCYCLTMARRSASRPGKIRDEAGQAVTAVPLERVLSAPDVRRELDRLKREAEGGDRPWVVEALQREGILPVLPGMEGLLRADPRLVGLQGQLAHLVNRAGQLACRVWQLAGWDGLLLLAVNQAGGLLLEGSAAPGGPLDQLRHRRQRERRAREVLEMVVEVALLRFEGYELFVCEYGHLWFGPRTPRRAKRCLLHRPRATRDRVRRYRERVRRQGGPRSSP
jgi:hypothetical protein